MGQIPYAAFDPIFWGHHHGRSSLAVMAASSSRCAPFPRSPPALPRMTVQQTLDVTALGYDYAVSSSAQRVEGT